jgi:hypothetical protein
MRQAYEAAGLIRVCRRAQAEDFCCRTLLECLLKTNRYKLATLCNRDVIVCIDTS